METSIDLAPIVNIIREDINKGNISANYDSEDETKNPDTIYISTWREYNENDEEYERWKGWRTPRKEFIELEKFIFDNSNIGVGYSDMNQEHIDTICRLLEPLLDNKYTISLDIDYIGGRGVGDMYNLKGIELTPK